MKKDETIPFDELDSVIESLEKLGTPDLEKAVKSKEKDEEDVEKEGKDTDEKPKEECVSKGIETEPDTEPDEPYLDVTDSVSGLCDATKELAKGIKSGFEAMDEKVNSMNDKMESLNSDVKKFQKSLIKPEKEEAPDNKAVSELIPFFKSVKEILVSLDERTKTLQGTPAGTRQSVSSEVALPTTIPDGSTISDLRLRLNKAIGDEKIEANEVHDITDLLNANLVDEANKRIIICESRGGK